MRFICCLDMIFNWYTGVKVFSYHTSHIVPTHIQKRFDNFFKQSRKIDISQIQPRKVEKEKPSPVRLGFIFYTNPETGFLSNNFLVFQNYQMVD